MVFNRKLNKTKFNLQIDGKLIEQVQKFKYLGITFDENNTFKSHIENVISNTKKTIGRFKYLSNKVTGANENILLKIYKLFIRPKMEYGVPIWGGQQNID